MSSRPTITAAIIATNEAQHLAELLPQLRWADEIVVVDGGSTDGTRTVARRHGARVAFRPFDNFAAQRNYALRLAGGQWVLSIDADERPSSRLAAEIRRRIAGSRQAGFRIPIRSTIFGRRFRFSGTQDDQPVRLVRRAGARWAGHVHERLHVCGSVGRLEGWLWHQTLPDLHAFLAKMHRYTMLEAQARLAAGRPPGGVDLWIGPLGEVLRRLVWKGGLLDGPQGWAFCLLSGLSQWVLARRHRRLWRARQAQPSVHAACTAGRSEGSLAPPPAPRRLRMSRAFLPGA